MTAASATSLTSTNGRAAARERFERSGLPHRRLESWKWTDLRSIVSADLKAASNPAIGRSLFADLDAFEITVMNGDAQWAGEPPAGVTIALARNDGALSPAEEDHPLANRCAAIVETRLSIEVEAGARLSRPIHLRHVNGGGASDFWAMARLLPGADATVIESFDGAGPYFSNSVLSVGLDDAARLTRVVIQDGSEEGIETALLSARLGAASRFQQLALMIGAKAARLETRAYCLGEGGDVSMRGATLAEGARHADHTSLVSIHAPRCVADQQHRSVAKDRGRAVFQGKFHVAREGQQANARMQARALPLSDGADIAHKPELEIYADDVKCSHGSAIGSLDPEAVFYMRQRGLSEREAQALLIEAFIAGSFDDFDDDAVAAALRQRAQVWLGAT